MGDAIKWGSHISCVTGKANDRLTLTERTRQVSFKLCVHFDKWIGSDSMATVLMSNGSYSTERQPEKKVKKEILIVIVSVFLAIFERSFVETTAT